MSTYVERHEASLRAFRARANRIGPLSEDEIRERFGRVEPQWLRVIRPQDLDQRDPVYCPCRKGFTWGFYPAGFRTWRWYLMKVRAMVVTASFLGVR